MNEALLKKLRMSIERGRTMHANVMNKVDPSEGQKRSTEAFYDLFGKMGSKLYKEMVVQVAREVSTENRKELEDARILGEQAFMEIYCKLYAKAVFARLKSEVPTEVAEIPPTLPASRKQDKDDDDGPEMDEIKDDPESLEIASSAPEHFVAILAIYMRIKNPSQSEEYWSYILDDINNTLALKNSSLEEEYFPKGFNKKTGKPILSPGREKLFLQELRSRGHFDAPSFI